MNTTLKVRAAALVASIAITFGVLELMQQYAHPTGSSVVLVATATR